MKMPEKSIDLKTSVSDHELKEIDRYLWIYG